MKTRLQKLSGFKKYATLFGMGAAMTLALPPLGFFPVIFLSVPCLIILAQQAPTRFRSFLCGWAFGAGYFIFGLYWVSAALFVDIQQWGWVLPLSLIAGPALLGLFYSLVPLCVWHWREKPEAYTLLFVSVWALVEYARGHILTGFPWNLPGQVWDHTPAILQTVSLTGIYGLSLLTLFWAAVPLLYHKRGLTIAATLSFVLLAGFGIWRMIDNPTKQSGDVEIRIVQPNLPQNVKWDDDAQWRNLEHHIKLSRSTDTEETPPPRFIIWPETAVDADLEHFPDITRYIANSLPANAIAIVGNMRVTLDKQQMATGYHNSLTMFGKDATVLGTYNKHHLVPFGEYIPFRQNFASIKPLAAAMSGIGDFTPGDGAKTLRPEGMPAFSPLICYEVIFPAAVVDQNDRPAWLVNVTNDGWYGRTAGPHQHLAIARLRAIEEGLPLARAANTGISAVIDPLGRIIAQQPLLTEGTLDSILPEALPPTLYSRIGDSAFWGLFLFFTSLGLFMSYRQKNS